MSGDMHHEFIKARIRQKGGSLAMLAKEESACGRKISAQALSLSLSGRVSARCEQIIADFLEIHPQEIWPSRYREDGTRIEKSRQPSPVARKVAA